MSKHSFTLTQTKGVACRLWRGEKSAQRCARINRLWYVVPVLVIMLSLGIEPLVLSVGPAFAAGPNTTSLHEMVLDGQAEAALQMVVEAAEALGGWQPAPGDEVVYDRFLPRSIRGSMQDFDEMPYDCADPQVSADEATCLLEFKNIERQVRFGRSLFSTRAEDGAETPRPAFDDLVSTYIEEVGHSWQEYLYETDGLGVGRRAHGTTRAESERWAAGREYQIKRYILNLDGSLLSLSEQQRTSLRDQICKGYANPMGHEVPPYGAPDGWPQPEGWPVTNPAPEEFQAFCATT